MRVYLNHELEIIVGILNAMSVKHSVVQSYDDNNLTCYDINIELKSTKHVQMVKDLCGRALMVDKMMKGW